MKMSQNFHCVNTTPACLVNLCTYGDTLGIGRPKGTCNNFVINVDPRCCNITLQVKRASSVGDRRKYSRCGIGPPPLIPEELYDENRIFFRNKLYGRSVNGHGSKSNEYTIDPTLSTSNCSTYKEAKSILREKVRLAERKKADGNDKYTNKQYWDALQSYTKAIEFCPDCAAYYSNRSACYMMLGKYTEALADARESVRLDAEFVKGYLRVGKCNIALGDANAALSVLRQASDIDATKAVRDEICKAQTLSKCLDEVNKFIARKEYRTALFHIEKALIYAVACLSLKISKAENLVLLSRFSEAEAIVNTILQSDAAQPDAIYVRGLCLYFQDNQSAAFTHFQHVLRLAPDHRKARDAYKKAKLLRQKKDAGNIAFNKSQWHEAINLYTEAIAVDPTNKATLAKLFFNRATAGAKLNKFEASIKDCSEAIINNDNYIKAYIRRGKSYQAIENYEEAVRDFEKATRLSGGHEYARLLREAKIQLKKSKRKDYYKILGISKNASDDEIKKAYKKKALLHHPDRHANSSEKERREHEVQFKEIGEAYTILTDAKKKSMYENGQDLNDTDDYNFSDGGIDPSELFQAFFSNGGGGNPFGGGQGRHHYSFSGGSGGAFNFMG